MKFCEKIKIINHKVENNHIFAKFNINIIKYLV